MKMIHYISLLLGLAVVLLGCSQNDELSAYTKNGKLTIIATADGFTSAGNGQTRASDNGYDTTFSNGDQIGVFATLNDRVVVDNVACTYSNGQWTGDVIHREGATYFAYYPYSSAMIGKTSTDAIVKNFQVAADQGSKESYTANDLMTATGSISAGTGNKKLLTLSFTHALSLVEFSLIVKGTCHTSTNYSYTCILEANSHTFQVGTTSIKPYFVNGTYRYLTKAGSSVTVSGSFGADDSHMGSFSKTYTLVSGQYEKLNLSYTSSSTTARDLAFGDYYYSDGSICPENVPNPPTANCIGVVYCVDQNFINNNSTKQNSHGLVVALKDANPSPCNWSTAQSSANNYSVTHPSSSSSWYFPNKAEMQYMSMWTTYPTKSAKGRDKLEEQFNKLGNIAEKINRDGKGYWTSTYYGNPNRYWRVVFQYDGDSFWNENTDNYHSRSSLAF